MIRLLSRVVYLCAVVFIAYCSFAYAFDVLHNATPSPKEQRAWVAQCKVRTNLPCVP